MPTQATCHTNREFWPLDIPPVLTFAGAGAKLTGHRQWTDLLLLRHAIERKGKLVTFDGGIATLAGKESQLHTLVLTGI